MTATNPLRVAALAALLCVAPRVTAQQNQTPAQKPAAAPVEPPPTPDAERASFTVADGFEVTLYAAEPMVEKPIAINFDPQGRLWVATSNTYPQVKPGQTPDDKIYVLEDTDGDGKADKSTVFAENLLIPTGVVPGDGGAYVANSTDVIHFTDKDGDLKADGYQVVLSGFGTEDTHHIIHTFRWGYDGRLYFNQSVYIHSNVETPYGRRTMNSSGTWRFRPENSKLDIFSQGMWNPWGHTYDRFGNSFQTDGAGSGGVHYVFPGSVFVTAKDAINKDIERKLGGMNEGSPKFCGAEMVGGSHLPDDWQNNVVTNDFRANRVVRFKIEEQPGGGYFTSKPMPDVIKSSSRFFRPLDLKMGPDGAIYLADWCNQIINHGEVDFRDPRRDKGHGRIWRIAAKNRPPVARPKLVGEGAMRLMKQLESPEPFAREQAKIVLRTLPRQEVTKALHATLDEIQGDDAKADSLRLELLWVFQSIDVPNPNLLTRLLNSKDYRVRAAAVRVIPDWQTKLGKQPLELLGVAAMDESARVRLEAVSALASINSPAAVEVAMRAAEKPLDPTMEFNLWRTANLTKDNWLPAFQEGKLKFGGRTDQMTRALQAVKSADAVKTLVTQLKDGKLPAAARGDIFDLIAAVGNTEDQRVTFDAAVAADAPAGERVRALAALDRAARARNVRPNGVDAAKLTALFTAPDITVATAAVRFGAAWQAAQLRPQFESLAAADGTPPSVRAAAVDALADIGPDGAAALRKLADVGTPDRRLLAVGALSRLDLKDASARAAEVLASAPAGTDPETLLAAILQREGGADALNAALATKPLPKDTAKLALRYLNTSGKDAGKLLETVRTAAGIGATAKPPTPEELAKIVADVQAKGDAARGEVVFRRADMSCYNCHMIAGAGAAVGPDLRSIGASSPLDYIVEALVVPSKAVKEGYESLIVATKKGDVFSGIRVSKDDQQLILRDATHDRIAIPLADIKRQKDGGSLMPAGLADTLTEQEFLDLCRFMAELGKPGAFAADKPGVVRRWQLLDANMMAASVPAGSPKAAWRTVYSSVAGGLPVDAMTAVGDTVLARADIDVTAAGSILLNLNDIAGVTDIRIDGEPTKPAAAGAITPPLPAGRHTVTLTVAAAKRGGIPLQLEVKDAPGEAGRAQPVGGR